MNINIIRQLFAATILAGVSFFQVAYAALDLELTRGSDSTIPIAIVPFGDQIGDAISNIVNADLKHSGRFKVSGAGSITQFPHTASEVNFSYWQNQKVSNVVVGKVRSTGAGYQVQFQLLDSFGNKAGASPILLTRDLSVNSQNLRQVAHRISDMIYEKLTGVRGIFSTRIAYVQVVNQGGNAKRYSLEVADVDGYNPKALLVSSMPIMSPSWSPDGRRLAYVSFEKKQPAIFIQEVASGRRHQLTDYVGINGAPRWSPDGSKIAAVLTISGNPNIYILDANSGRVLRQVTSGTAIDTEPNWSPDGQTLVFTSNRGGGPQIYRVSVNGGQPQRVTFTGRYNATPSFTPDGKNIIVLHSANGLFNVGMQNLASGRFKVLTRSIDAQSPSIAPNGQMVLFAALYGRQGMLGMVGTNDQVQLQLPGRNGNVREPAWSPFLNW